MQRHFMPRFYEHAPMHHDVGHSKLQCYSPIPLRDYRRTTYGGEIVEFKVLLRNRDQSVWNLLWLTTPEVDDALDISNTMECTQYRQVTFPLMRERYTACRGFSKSVLRLNGHDYSVRDLVKREPAAEFWNIVKRDQRLLGGVRRIFGDNALASMEARAVGRDHIRVINPILRAGHIDRCVPAAEAARTIQRTYEYRIDWLTRVTEFLRGYVESCGFSMPRVTIALDSPKADRHGAWHWRSVGAEPYDRDIVAISPVHTGTRLTVATLIHEIAHGIAGPSAGHTKAFWDICCRLGLGDGYSDTILPALQEQIERIEEVHDPYPGAVWHYEWPEALA